MKNSLLILLAVLLSVNVFSQDWRDSLAVARSAYKQKNYEKALKYYQSAQKKAPDNVDLSDEMAQSAYKAREFEKAEKIYDQSSSKTKGTAEKAKTYHNIGNSRMQQKNYQGAVDAYKESLRNNPGDEKTRYNLSEAMRRLKDQQDQQKKKDKNESKDQNKKDQNNQNNQNDQNKDSKKDKGQNDPQKNKNQSGKPEEKDGDKQKGNQDKSNLPNKTVDRMLDKLMKDETETKRKVSGNKGEKGEATSGKDW